MKLTTDRLNNLRMNPETYALRRKVIDLIYQAKKLVPTLPRIEVRITDNHDTILGIGAMGKNIIWITKNFVAKKHVVFHEILHAVYAVNHDPTCPLMKACCDVNNLVSDTECDRIFLAYAQKSY